MGPTDAELVARLRTGDARAFDLAHGRYHAKIYAFLARMVLRRPVAEELAQETWLRLARSARRFDPDVHLSGWLFKVARNLAVSRERRRALEEDVMKELGDDRTPATPLDGLVASTTRAQLERALAALSPRDREVILLVGYEALAPREAAVALGLRPEALRKRLERAREKLRESMEER